MGWYLIADAKDTRTVLSDNLQQRFGAELKGIENAAAHGFSTSIHRDVVDQRNLTIFIRSIRSHVSLSHACGSGYEQYPTRAVHYSSVALGTYAAGYSKQGKSIMAPCERPLKTLDANQKVCASCGRGRIYDRANGKVRFFRFGVKRAKLRTLAIVDSEFDADFLLDDWCKSQEP